ncbi:hypothetical protein Glove_173g51 [Diversispora epigaea]|uniref:Uncharacterized protein n=1 Tax=Diversispora epigaea TaxID=1348612 RepID=A0A397ISH2_9GLOM|nr:hypothetical protein Glove_173g51 [Diversispora epigaea]
MFQKIDEMEEKMDVIIKNQEEYKKNPVPDDKADYHKVRNYCLNLLDFEIIQKSLNDEDESDYSKESKEENYDSKEGDSEDDNEYNNENNNKDNNEDNNEDNNIEKNNFKQIIID